MSSKEDCNHWETYASFWCEECKKVHCACQKGRGNLCGRCYAKDKNELRILKERDEIVRNFQKKISEGVVDLPPEVSKIINDNLFDLF